MATISFTLRQFELTEANLTKARRLLGEVTALIPDGICFGSDDVYEEKQRELADVVAALPSIDGWKPTALPLDLDTIAQQRLDAAEISEPEVLIGLHQQMAEPAQELAEYSFRLRKKRRVVLRQAVAERVSAVGALLSDLVRTVPEDPTELRTKISSPEWPKLVEVISEIGTLMGSSVSELAGWSNLRRHIAFGQYVDLREIAELDWPPVRRALENGIFDENEPLPVDVQDLGELGTSVPSGPIPVHLAWSVLSDESFERLIFALLVGDHSYENPQWLTKTRAPDRGRDVSATRVTRDGLAGVIRRRVLIQCKHWQSKSVAANELAVLKEQIRHWEPPRVDVLVIASSGYFSSDAVDLIERHNLGDNALTIEAWPASHLEMLLAARPALIAEFGLRSPVGTESGLTALRESESKGRDQGGPKSDA